MIEGKVGSHEDKARASGVPSWAHKHGTWGGRGDREPASSGDKISRVQVCKACGVSSLTNKNDPYLQNSF